MVRPADSGLRHQREFAATVRGPNNGLDRRAPPTRLVPFGSERKQGVHLWPSLPGHQSRFHHYAECDGAQLPGPYGTLASYNNPPINNAPIPASGTVSQIQVSVQTPLPAGWAAWATATAPFPIVIGGERLQVTGKSGGPPPSLYTLTLNGVRGVGGTSAGAHDIGSYVNSSPLPLLPSSFTDIPGTSPLSPCIYANGDWLLAHTRLPSRRRCASRTMAGR